MVEVIVFAISAAIILGGALGVILLRNTAHAALSLIASLFGVAVVFVAQEAHFLAAVQVIVYAGAIVVLFLFVLMLLGVKRDEDLSVEPLVGQRPAALIGGIAFLGLSLVALFAGGTALTGQPGASVINPLESDIAQLGRNLFTDHIFSFEATAILLTIAVVGAVVLVGRGSINKKDEEVTK